MLSIETRVGGGWGAPQGRRGTEYDLEVDQEGNEILCITSSMCIHVYAALPKRPAFLLNTGDTGSSTVSAEALSTLL